MTDVLTRIGDLKLVPVIVLDDDQRALPLGDALVAGGLPIAEITFRTAAAEESIRALAGRGDLLVGAGTVLTTKQVDRAVDAGAQFIVAPGTNPDVVEHSMRRGVTVTPGVATPTDIELAVSLGIRTVKFFPAEALGGIKMLKAVSAPYRNVRFIPTGGISPVNLRDYLDFPAVVACGGSWLAPRERLVAGDFASIERAVADAVAILPSVR